MPPKLEAFFYGLFSAGYIFFELKCKNILEISLMKETKSIIFYRFKN